MNTADFLDKRLAPETARGPAILAAQGLPRVAIVIVGFHNAGDILNCLRALSRMSNDPAFSVFVAENGGPEAMNALLSALGGANSPCRPAPDAALPIQPPMGSGHAVFTLAGRVAGVDARVYAMEMPENLGYAGAINACLRPLLAVPGWEGVWIVNPDTEPEPSALTELIKHATSRRRGMVGSRIRTMTAPDLVRTRGLAWNKLSARTMAVGFQVSADIVPDASEVEASLDSPSGASLYVTRALIGQIGLMDERFFLYFEDLEWGCRAKAVGQLGYAHCSVVPHRGGTTIGGNGTRSSVSALSVYLEFRNRIMFVRTRHPSWLPWTAFVQIAHALTYVLAGSPANMMAAFRGLIAGLRGEVGRPDHILKLHH